MTRPPFVALPLIALATVALLGAHCRSSDQAPEQPLASARPAAQKPAGALPTSGLSEGEATRLLPGVDTSALSPKQRQELVEIAGDTFCPCAAMTVAACLRADEVCRPAVRMTELARNLLASGQPQSHVLMRVEAYYASFAKERRADIRAVGPTKGKESARVTLVEFSDFECPSCRAIHPVLDEVVAKYPNDVKLVFQNFPLPQHPQAKEAAVAGAWVAEQGRFWPYSDLVFENQSRLAEVGVDRLVEQVGLDPKAMRQAIDRDTKYANKVEADKALGEQLQITGTPSVFINGRPLILAPSVDNLAWTIEDELEWLANGERWTAR